MKSQGYLHSNMVRFIMIIELHFKIVDIRIYIPIWLDLLYIKVIAKHFTNVYLHSNMVRFIIKDISKADVKRALFTFQYG